MRTYILLLFMIWISFCKAYLNPGPYQYMQSPMFLQDLHGTVKSSYQSHSSSGGVKTFTKTSSGISHSFPTSIEYRGGCKDIPTAPMNAGIKCSVYNGCKANCIPNYQFPNGEIQLYITCRDGEWEIEGTEWSTIPACEPICMPPCINNGICTAPNECNCPENYSGPQCQFQNIPCLNQPPMSINSRRTCTSKSCIIACLEGHQFPDGSQITNLMCENGMWMPTRQDWVTVPDCEPICSPPCQNGGNCLSFNVCQCPQEYRGPQCQYRADACTSTKLQFNGGYNCSITGEFFSCVLSCPEGVDFEFPPASIYTCSYDTGTFVPFPIPQCVYGHLIPIHGNNMYYNEFNSSFSFGGAFMEGQQIEGTGKISFDSQNTFIPEIHFPVPNPPPEKLVNNIQFIQNPNSVSGEYSVVETKKPEPGICFTWGGTHFKTFDGKVFSFESSCAHVLVRDLEDHTFSVIVKNNKECEINKECYRIVHIYLQDKEYILTKKNGVPVFASPKKIFPIPARLAGIRAEMSAHYFVVIIDPVGVTIKWDGQQLVQVEVKENMWNRTEGLCGRIDGNPHNDMIAKSGLVPKSVVTLATSWQVDNVQATCNNIPKEEHACQDNNDKNSEGHKAMDFCQKLLSDNRFKVCHSVMDVFMLLDACRWDYCNCEDFPEKCACQTLNVYVRECAHKGVTTLTKWRDQEFCPMQCSGNRVYMPCAPPEGQEVCGDVHEKSNEDGTCEEGCYCPQGTVLHNSECIIKENCPCRLRGKDFPPGSSVPKDCNTCTCLSGKWVCTQVACGGRCSALGDPHYITFDGKRYDFMGQCSYYLVKHTNFSIEAENVPCSGAISQAMNLPSAVTSGLPSCTKTVTIRISDQTIKLKQNHQVTVNGQEITRIPYKIADVNIRSVSSIFLLVELPEKVEVWWDGLSRVYVDLPAIFKRQTGGLCGTFTDNQKDDFLTPEGDIEKTPGAFANKWKTAEKCTDVTEKLVSHPCEANIQNKATAEQHCSIIKSKEFEDCHWYVDPEPFYQDCMYDVCACETKELSSCLCPMISAYAQECALKGIKVDWRNNVRECGIRCTGGQKYQICGNSCTRTCSDVSLHPDCDRLCIEGCNCPEGEALDEYGECIPIGQCSCQHEGLEFRAGYKEVRPASKGLELCTCLNAQWSCQPATEEEVKKYPNAGDLKTMCDSSKNWEFTTCESERPTTCKNMHSIEYATSSECHPGCQCKEGYVLDSHSNECVQPTECPCHHGGRSYGENAIVQSDCNTCTCKGGKWSCTERQCAAECSTWGDSHYKTFDGKMYDYQGQCDYVLAKGVLTTDESFDISIQNVPCGALGVSCSKSVTIKVGHGSQMEKITLTRESSIPVGTGLKRMSIRQKGLFVIVEAAELGLVILWDKGTRVYIKLDPQWKDKVKGLCGNYNDNENDDFQTPSGGITEVSAQLFGDSWKLQSYCPETVEITDTCEQRPDRKIWAVKKCSILKSSLFAPCHSEVSVDDYLNRCIFDTCACDQGGDCECLCTALAAYAQECNNKGVPVKWRSQELCPIQCDQRCSKYSPCISTCPLETCDNLPVQSKLSKLCTESSCIEGCQMKPCPPGHIFLNSSALDCVPINVCKPVCLKIGEAIYYEGDIIEEDECHVCFCSRGQKFCKGHPCAATTTTEPQKEQRLKCVNGWTKWLNQDRIPARKTKIGQKKLTDIEPLPSQLLMNQMKGKARCSVNEMTDIECRTVKGHKHPKETDLDVECSLEGGLVCKSKEGEKPCEDFEIRVKCQCEETTSSTATTPPVTTVATVITASPCDLTTPNQEHPTDCHLFYECVTNMLGQAELVEKSCGSGTLYNPKTYVCDWAANVISIKPQCGEGSLCPSGEKFDSCAVDCNNMCMYYKYLMKQNGFCNNYEDCVKGCVSELKPSSCPNGMLWSSNQTCVQKQNCMCVTDQGKPVKPGTVVKESDCAVCQCIDNFYTCDESACVTKEMTSTFETSTTPSTSTTVFGTTPELKTSSTISSTGTEVFTIKNTETPPPECDGSRFINLIDGDTPLPDEAFSASSELGQYFSPKYARLNNEVTDGSGGSWIPKSSDQSQYLQIDLGKQEPVYGIILRGSPLYNNFVTSYKVTYSPDGFTFRYITDENNQPKIFRGPTDNKEAVKQMFPVPVEAKLIKILPVTWHDTIALRVELLGCGEESVITTETPTTVTQTETVFSKLSTKPPPPLCTEVMGVDNGLIADEQISVSSELNKDHDKTQLKMNGVSYWQPLTNSPLEWVQFDFLEPRNITGFVSKGGPNGWVTKFKIKFSHDGKVWYAILDGSRNEKEFLGNYDENSEQTNYFDLPLQARFFKLLPEKWHRNIQLRAEVLGCYKPYPTTTKTPPVVKNCDSCPGVTNVESELDICKCEQGLWWDGENCVQRSQCPCMVGHFSYAVGTVFEKEDCSQCICKLGGIEHCTPKECEKCEEGLRKVVTSTCGCICQPCNEGTILCPTNNICINSTLWCNGIEDCSDDELSCTTDATITATVPTTEITTVTKASHLTCSTPSCPPGYKLKIKRPSKAEKLHSNLSPMFSFFGRKASNKRNYRSVKGFTKKGTKSKTTKNLKKPVAFKHQLKEAVEEDLQEQKECPRFSCEPPPPQWVNGSEYHCPPAICPAGYTPEYHQEEIKTGGLNCPRYTCQQPPLPDAVCNITGRTFITFDNTEFKYDICEHVLVRDVEEDLWEIVLRKTCTVICSRELVIYYDEHLFVLHPDLSVEFDNYKYTVDQTKKIGSQSQSFMVSRLGDVLLFISHHYRFWIIWDKNANVKIGVAGELSRKVDGLCGYFNYRRWDDKRKPDGMLAKTTVEFGDSWGSINRPQICEVKACPIHVQNKAWEMCQKVKQGILALCNSAIDVEAFISRCLETTCNCLQEAEEDTNREDQCRCGVLQSFVVDCMTSDPSLELSDWRMQQDCPAICDAPLVHYDCYRRRCEPSCESLSDPNACPQLSHVCFPGCYCPPGYVHKGGDCVLPTACRDCECTVLPHLQYISYDGNNVSVSGNCDYVMTRDVTQKENGQHRFQVIITNGPCEDNKKKMCVMKVTILHHHHEIVITKDNENKNFKVNLNSEQITHYGNINDWLDVLEGVTKHLLILLKDEQVEIFIYFPLLGVSVKAPSMKHGGKLEGLCGDCDGDIDNDMRISNGTITKNSEDFALAWLSSGQSTENCLNKPEKECKPLPIESDPCLLLVDIEIFGKV
ncbi:hemocytin [Agrilus planipennis]|uniref:Hemocytin n=1 Tax=Agrilus planipennis TaxID=224129 RepID=A0A7F5RK93_AGRPL|nr:hemocytin [Agrilus planipennis]